MAVESALAGLVEIVVGQVQETQRQSAKVRQLEAENAALTEKLTEQDKRFATEKAELVKRVEALAEKLAAFAPPEEPSAPERLVVPPAEELRPETLSHESARLSQNWATAPNGRMKRARGGGDAG